MLQFLVMGTVLGLSAGMAPGPLLTLVISESLQHGIKAGMKVALAPIITDAPIIIATLFLLSQLSDLHVLLGILSLAGGLFIFFLGYQGMRTKGVELELKETEPRSLLKGVLANALSPHPYLFWLTVGAPTLTRAAGQGACAAAAFIAGFYVFLVGSKIALAVLVGRSRSLFSSMGYVFTLRSLGFVMCLLAIVLLHDGLRLLKIL